TTRGSTRLTLATWNSWSRTETSTSRRRSGTLSGASLHWSRESPRTSSSTHARRVITGWPRLSSQTQNETFSSRRYTSTPSKVNWKSMASTLCSHRTSLTEDTETMDGLATTRVSRCCSPGGKVQLSRLLRLRLSKE